MTRMWKQIPDVKDVMSIAVFAGHWLRYLKNYHLQRAHLGLLETRRTGRAFLISYCYVWEEWDTTLFDNVKSFSLLFQWNLAFVLE